ncbi:MAG: hypothetical protein ACU0BF_05545 [Paracoccaceae bacterium]
MNLPPPRVWLSAFVIVLIVALLGGWGIPEGTERQTWLTVLLALALVVNVVAFVTHVRNWRAGGPGR